MYVIVHSFLARFSITGTFKNQDTPLKIIDKQKQHLTEAATTKLLPFHIYRDVTYQYFSLQITQYIPQIFRLLNISRKLSQQQNSIIEEKHQPQNIFFVIFTIPFLLDLFLSRKFGILRKYVHQTLNQRRIFLCPVWFLRWSYFIFNQNQLP